MVAPEEAALEDAAPEMAAVIAARSVVQTLLLQLPASSPFPVTVRVVAAARPSGADALFSASPAKSVATKKSRKEQVKRWIIDFFVIVDTLSTQGKREYSNFLKEPFQS